MATATKKKQADGLPIPGYPEFRAISTEKRLEIIGRYGPRPIDDAGDHETTHYVVRLETDRYTKTVPVLDLICRAYHGAPPSRSSVPVQINGDTSNYLPENLKWGTPAEAKASRAKWDSGECTLTLEDRRRIWDMYRVERIPPQSIASEFECDLGIVFQIVTGKRP